jgi:hypothetical protein
VTDHGTAGRERPAIDELRRDATSRERFLKIAGGGAVASAFAAFVAACGGDDEASAAVDKWHESAGRPNPATPPARDHICRAAIGAAVGSPVRAATTSGAAAAVSAAPAGAGRRRFTVDVASGRGRHAHGPAAAAVV